MDMADVPYDPANPSTQQPNGPEYSFSMGRYEVTVAQYMTFLNDAEAVVDWVAILREGRLVGAGPAQEILPESRPTFRVRLSGDLDAFRTTLSRLGVSGDLDSRGAGLLLPPPGAGSRILFQAAREASAYILSLQPHRPSLEEAFFHALDEEP